MSRALSERALSDAVREQARHPLPTGAVPLARRCPAVLAAIEPATGKP